MRYYVVSDIHSYYKPLEKALADKGFFEDNGPKKLIVCGDMMDRGNNSRKVEEFMLDLYNKGELVFIRGNHEDLMFSMLNEIKNKGAHNVSGHHINNGTFKTALSLAKTGYTKACERPDLFLGRVLNSPFMKTLVPNSVNYYETENFIFVHGWIPCQTENLPPYYRRGRTYTYDPDWRSAGQREWDTARWFNGMELCELNNIRVPDKTVVCGHWHASYGHSQISGKCSEFGKDAIFDPYIADGIYAIDACTAHTQKVNCIVIEDEELKDEKRT